jgi:hypothetical protein
MDKLDGNAAVMQIGPPYPSGCGDVSSYLNTPNKETLNRQGSVLSSCTT